MPPEAGDIARLQADAAALGVPLDGVAAERLLRYRDLLLRWNKVYNLTSIRDADEARDQHLIDCLAILPALRRQLNPAPTGQGGMTAVGSAGRPSGVPRVLDVGSGGGLPGVVIAIAEPGWSVDCIDTVGKKAAFVTQVSAELGGLHLRGLHGRVEVHRAEPFGYDLITSRAFASLADFVRLSRHLLAPTGVWAAMKGVVPDDEIAALPPDVDVFHVEPIRRPDREVQRCLVWMRPAQRRPT